MKTKNNEVKSESDETRCWIENPQAQVLRVELSDGSFHLCPYSWLVWVRFSSEKETDTVTLLFNSHTVSIIGKNLRELALAFQRMNVETVKQGPEPRKTSANDRVFIQTIQIEKGDKTSD